MLHPKHAQIIMQFLSRTDLKGSEWRVFGEIWMALEKLAQPEELPENVRSINQPPAA